jgi:leucine dehydrogenase
MPSNDFRTLDYMKRYDYENLAFFNDNSVGLKGVIAIHDTTLGPAGGGTRMWTYGSEWEAAEDALRLARGMTYKYAAAGVDLGGGKAVIIGNPKTDKNEALIRAFGRFVERLGGLFYTGEDVGTTLEDMETMYRETRFMITLPQYLGGAGSIAGATSTGVILGMKVAMRRITSSDSLNGLTIGVQGLGAVGYEVVKQLSGHQGVKLKVCDIDKERTERVGKEFNVKVVQPESIYSEPMDVFCPCALGGIINGNTIPKLKCKLVAGSANNQLLSEEDGYAIEKADILYAPDYVINAGGAVYDSDRLFGTSHNHERAMAKVMRVADTLARIFDQAEKEHIPTFIAADRIAEQRIANVAKAKGLRTRWELK